MSISSPDWRKEYDKDPYIAATPMNEEAEGTTVLVRESTEVS